ncbi:MAG: aminotransferase class V-fold PLP-dependent enzyme [Eisenbergiella sp.]
MKSQLVMGTSNLLPWQMVSRRTGAELKFLECGQEGELTEEQIRKTHRQATVSQLSMFRKRTL